MKKRNDAEKYTRAKRSPSACSRVGRRGSRLARHEQGGPEDRRHLRQAYTGSAGRHGRCLRADAVQGDRLEVVGRGNAHVFIKAPSNVTITWHTLGPGNKAELKRERDGAVALARSPSLTALTHLVMQGCGIEAADAVAIATAPELPRLAVLDLTYNPMIRDQGARALADAPALAAAQLILSACRVSKDCQRDLHQRYGDRVSFG